MTSRQHGGPRNNLADELQILMSKVSAPADGDNFIQHVSCQRGRSPSVILYTAEQIKDLRLFCFSDVADNLRSVFCVDRTFNLSSYFVTVTVFKHRKLVRESSQDSPIFIGPIMLHGDGHFSTYLNFFATICGALNCSDIQTTVELNFDEAVLGSDEERALVKAMKTIFRNSSNLYCIKHVEDNVNQHMARIGVGLEQRREICALLFSAERGLSSSKDDTELDNRVATALQYVSQNGIDAADYLKERVIPKIRNNWEVRQKNTWISRQQHWYNNNCESANHVLKLTVNWKVQSLLNLIENLKNLVDLQYRELRRAIGRNGDFRLAPDFRKHECSDITGWMKMYDEDKMKHSKYIAFMSDSGPRRAVGRERTITSTDRQLTITGSQRIARKNHQRRRPTAERTNSHQGYNVTA